MKTYFIENEIFSDQFAKKKAIGLIHRLYVTQLKNAQKHTASTKTKSEVRGGGRKPRPQKGQGYARSGSIRSPLWVGGGVIFGPKPHIVKKKINKKERRLAIISALYLKKKEWIVINETIFNESLTFKTKNIINILKVFQIDPRKEKILFIMPEQSTSFWLSCRNIKNIKVLTANCLNVKELLHANKIFLSESCIEMINYNYRKNYE